MWVGVLESSHRMYHVLFDELPLVMEARPNSEPGAIMIQETSAFPEIRAE